jgi:translation initiation factor IF-3
VSQRQRTPSVRINHTIRAPKVRLIGADGVMVGVVTIKEAVKLAQAAELDLIEVAAEAEPPVCKIYSYSKWKYEQDQKEREKRKNHVETKEFKFNVRIGESDIMIKCRKINETLEDGDRARVVVVMKGRERSHPELAHALMERVLRETSTLGKLDGRVNGDSGRISAQILPKKG